MDLGQIDLLVAEGFYGNRTDLIRTAIRNQLGRHADELKQVAARKMLVLGLQHLSAADLQAAVAARQRLQIRVIGLVNIAADVTPELALASIESLQVLGALQGPSRMSRPPWPAACADARAPFPFRELHEPLPPVPGADARGPHA